MGTSGSVMKKRKCILVKTPGELEDNTRENKDQTLTETNTESHSEKSSGKQTNRENGSQFSGDKKIGSDADSTSHADQHNGLPPTIHGRRQSIWVDNQNILHVEPPEPFFISEEFRKIDEHVSKTPESVAESLHTLLEYLVEDCSSQSEMARAFYRWITEHIRYKTDCSVNTDPEKVLESRLTNAKGYSQFFKEFCSMANIEAKVITGYTRDLGYDLQQMFSFEMEPDHTWNVVNADGMWRFVDCTWGAGCLIDEEFVKEYNDFYFFTDPRQVIFTHFPYIEKNPIKSRKWQLMDTPVNIVDFSQRARVTMNALIWGFRCVTHLNGQLTISKREDIVFECDSRHIREIMVNLLNVKTNVSDEAVYARQDSSGVFKVTVRPPTRGQFKLQVYGSVEKRHARFKGLVEYLISCQESELKFRPYPAYSGSSKTWQLNSTQHNAGIDKSVYRYERYIVTEPGEIQIKIKTEKRLDARAKIEYSTLYKLDEVSKSNHCKVEGNNDSLLVKAYLPIIGYYKLNIFIQETNSVNGDIDIPYLIECRLSETESFVKMTEMWES